VRVVIIDYGMGNIKSISSTLKYLGVTDVSISADASIIKSSDKIILPGVGSFGSAMQNIRKLSLDEIIHQAVNIQRTPILGICLGMQLMGTDSTEEGYNRGLGLVRGNVQRFKTTSYKIPHVGFNQILYQKKMRLYKDIDNRSDFYFTHSYRMSEENGLNCATCDYSESFIASYEIDNIAGVQFHPELSQKNGLTLLKNFLEQF
jgi:imidazole glycerol-phosphate synthase subunit HisH